MLSSVACTCCFDHRLITFFGTIVLRWPAGGVAGGRDIDALTSYVDFMPTLLDLCGIRVAPARTFHGRSLRPLLEGATGGVWDERVVVSDTQRVATPVKWRKSSVMKRKWRLINGTALYDLRSDPGQRSDVAGAHPEVVAELRSAYERWWDVVSAQFDRDVPIAIARTTSP